MGAAPQLDIDSISSQGQMINVDVSWSDLPAINITVAKDNQFIESTLDDSIDAVGSATYSFSVSSDGDYNVRVEGVIDNSAVTSDEATVTVGSDDGNGNGNGDETGPSVSIMSVGHSNGTVQPSAVIQEGSAGIAGTTWSILHNGSEVASSDRREPTFEVGEPGTYTLRVTVTDNNFNQGEDSQQFSVTEEDLGNGGDNGSGGSGDSVDATTIAIAAGAVGVGAIAISRMRGD